MRHELAHNSKLVANRNRNLIDERHALTRRVEHNDADEDGDTGYDDTSYDYDDHDFLVCFNDCLGKYTGLDGDAIEEIVSECDDNACYCLEDNTDFDCNIAEEIVSKCVTKCMMPSTLTCIANNTGFDFNAFEGILVKCDDDTGDDSDDLVPCLANSTGFDYIVVEEIVSKCAILPTLTCIANNIGFDFNATLEIFLKCDLDTGDGFDDQVMAMNCIANNTGFDYIFF